MSDETKVADTVVTPVAEETGAPAPTPVEVPEVVAPVAPTTETSPEVTA